MDARAGGRDPRASTPTGLARRLALLLATRRQSRAARASDALWDHARTHGCTIACATRARLLKQYIRHATPKDR